MRELKSFADIVEVAERDWDSILDPDDLQISWKFVRACQSSGVEDAVYRHLVIRNRGEVECVASVFSLSVALELLAGAGARALVGRARKWKPTFLRPRFVLCGLPVSFGQPCLRFSAHADRGACLALIAGAMEEFAETVGASVLGFKEFGEPESRRLGALERLGYRRARSLPGCSLALPWASFGEYLSALRSPYRRQLLEDLRRPRRHEISRERVDLEVAQEEIYPLYEQVIDRASHRLERLNAAFFRELASHFRAEGRALLLRRNGALLAAAIVLHGPTRSTFLLTGLDYEANARFATYPMLLAEVVREALDRGALRLELGQTSYALKSRFGGKLTPRWIYLRHRNSLLDRALAVSSGTLFPATRAPARRVFRDA